MLIRISSVIARPHLLRLVHSRLLVLSIFLGLFAIPSLIVKSMNGLMAAEREIGSELSVDFGEPTVEQNIIHMDKDHDGIVTVFEVRAFLEAMHGKGYQTKLMDEIERSAGGKSCDSPFAKPLY